MTPPESQELESFFEKLTETPTAPGKKDTSLDPAEEFNALFQKLSSLDDLDLAADVIPVVPPVAEVSGRTAEASLVLTQERKRYKATVQGRTSGTDAEKAKSVQAARIQRRKARAAAAGTRDAGAGATPAARIPVSRPLGNAPRQIRRRGTALERTGKVLKITAIWLALFGVGLGAVWAALSLPHRIEQAMPTGTGQSTAENQAGQKDKRPIAQNLRGSAAPTATLDAALGSTRLEGRFPITRMSVSATPTDAPPPAAAATTRTAGKSAARSGTRDTPPAASRIQDTPVPTRPLVTPSPKSVTGDKFALQVGACRSERCLQNYRKMLLPYVQSDAIRIVSVARGDGSGTVQRVRVEPLDLAQARKLKNDLAADARLKSAYVISLN